MNSDSGTAQGSMPLGDFLWCDRQILLNRHKKTAASLVAVQRVLAEHMPSNKAVTEFLHLYDYARGVPDTVFSEVWTEPAAYYWVRNAYQLVGQVLNPAEVPAGLRNYTRALAIADPREALFSHLREFCHFALGMAILAEKSLLLDSPVVVNLPYAVLGTTHYLDGVGDLTILGVSDGQLDVSVDGTPVRLALDETKPDRLLDISVKHCPVIEHEDAVFLMQPYALDWPGVDFVKPAVDVGMEFQQENKDVVLQTLKLIQRYTPAVYEQLAEYMHSIVLKPIQAGAYTNLSHSDFPGASMLGLRENPFSLAEALIHEFHHQRLFCVEEAGAFFENANHLEESGFYSPWRGDLRPLHGVFHAIYVHIPVADFWFNLLRSPGQCDELLEMMARDRLARIQLQCEIGIYQLQNHAQLTAFGLEILGDMVSCVADLGQRLAILGVDHHTTPPTKETGSAIHLDTSAHSVFDAVRKHADKYDAARQTTEFFEKIPGIQHEGAGTLPEQT